MASDQLAAMRRKDKICAVATLRIVMAVFLGTLLGGYMGLVQPRSLFQSNSISSAYVRIPTSSSSTNASNLPLSTVDRRELARIKEEVVALREKSEIATLKEIELQKVILELEASRQQFENCSSQLKVGPVKTMKNHCTSSLVEINESINPALAKILEKVAINRELIVGVANGNVLEILRIWFENIQRSGVSNFLVVALDEETQRFCNANGVPVYRRQVEIAELQKDTAINHAISGLKFHLLREFLALGYSVLLSDVDVVYLQNPFRFIVGDCDVESMTDGIDDWTAYGYDNVSDDPKMGWARHSHSMRIWVLNSGLFYIRPTVASIQLLDRVTDRLSKEKGAWDQTLFNEELFYPSRPGYKGLLASKRVMDLYLFMNSKVLFRTVRKEDQWKNFTPVAVHVNYHPDKIERMLGIVDYYVLGNINALDRFPDGSEW